MDVLVTLDPVNTEVCYCEALCYCDLEWPDLIDKDYTENE